MGITLDGADTCIMCAFPYYCSALNRTGNLSYYTQCLDYHVIVKDKLEKTAHFLRNEIGAQKAACFTDVGAPVEKKLAVAAGIGIQGKNALVISPLYGTYFFIGYIRTDLDLPTDPPLKGGCANCGMCVKSCPGTALNDGLDALRCASYISQKRGRLTDDEAEILHRSGYVFGCDICQKVCPHNNVSFSPMKEFCVDIKESISLSEIEPLSNKEFLNRYGNRAFSWRGKNVLIRNLNIFK